MTMLTIAGAMSVRDERHNNEVMVNVRSRSETECMRRCSLKKLSIAAAAMNANEMPAEIPSISDTSCPSAELYFVKAMKYLVVL